MKIRRLFLFVICLALLFTTVIAPTSYSLAAEDHYDYSRDGSYFNTAFTSADILELLGYELTDAESAYLAKYATLSVRYEEIATTQDIEVSSNDDVTRVSASTYSYVASNGSTVIWTPIEATVNGKTAAMTAAGDELYASFEGVTVDSDSLVEVRYRMNAVSIKAGDINRIINLAYNDAVSLKAEIKTYVENESAINEYFVAVDRYSQYVSDKLVYDQKKALYDKYLADFAVYDSQLEKYESYLEALEKYYEDYDAYLNYDTALEKYEADIARYNRYLSDLSIAELQLKMLNDGLMSKVTYLDRQIYGCLFANLVDEVVAQKDKLTKIGAKMSDINDCDAATKKIRAILKPEDGVAYVDLKTTEEKYAFYVNNYEELRDSIILLTVSLHNIFDTDGVLLAMHMAANMLNKPNYTEKLAIFISQLVYFSNALSDETIMTKNGKAVLNGELKLDYRDESGADRYDVKLYDILEENIFVEDIANPKPINLVKVEEPSNPGERPVEPVLPEEVSKPIEPTSVQDPGEAPTVVYEPSRPEWLPEDPSRLDIVNNEIYLDLIDALDDGLLDGNREELTENISFSPTVTLKKSINVSDFVDVTFLDSDGSILTVARVERGSAVNFTGELPGKSEDLTAKYEFDRWVDESGCAFDLSSVNASVTLYPEFKTVYKDYPLIDEGYGAMYLHVSCTDEELSDIPLLHFLNVAKNNYYGIIIEAENVALMMPYSAVLELSQKGVERVSVKADISATEYYSCEVIVYGPHGEITEFIHGLSVELTCDDERFARDSELFYVDADGVTRVISKRYSEGAIIFDVTTGIHYSFVYRYSISANSNLSGKVAFPEYATPGEIVSIELDIPAGTVAEIYYSIYPNLSEKVRIDGKSFVMPFGNVRLSATFTVIEYTVKFVSDGKIIFERNDYKYGDTVKAPNAPTKLNDGENSYKFIGWSPEIGEVTGDVIYVAQFEATPLPVIKERVSLFNIVFYSGLTLFIVGTIAILLFILDRKKIISIRGVLSFVKRKLTRGGTSIVESTDDSGAQPTAESDNSVAQLTAESDDSCAD